MLKAKPSAKHLKTATIKAWHSKKIASVNINGFQTSGCKDVEPNIKNS